MKGMNKVKHLHVKTDNQVNKYDEILDYLKQDNGYWLENDKWDLTKSFFLSEKIYTSRYIDFTCFENEYIKNELKYYIIFNFKEKYMKNTHLINIAYNLKLMANFIESYYKDTNSLNEIMDIDALTKWQTFLLETKINTSQSLKSYKSKLSSILNFFKNFYDIREEIEKDKWYPQNIIGIKIPAGGSSNANNTSCMDFTRIRPYYRETVKKYFVPIITKHSYAHCKTILDNIVYFMDEFYSNNYTDGFIENLSRQDIEKYLMWVNIHYKGKNKTVKSKSVTYIRTFLEYIQMAQYDKAPKKEVSFLIFKDDIPKREKDKDAIKRVKFIPEPILKQIDNNIMGLDRPQFIPIYILLRETGWRGTDVLNLRYNDCLEQIWNSKEEKYNYYLCGEITKTSIPQLKIPIRDKVAEMVQKSIDKAKELSTEENNPKKYLFNTYEGQRKGKPLRKQSMINTVRRLIVKEDIRDSNGDLYHFKTHSLRHTRAKEYVEQGMGISIVQQILGHQSLQMTVHYATVSENILYEKWKNTEDLELFKVDASNNELIEVDTSTDEGENLIRYEYVKKNLDAVRVPFGVCFKASKLPCKQQMNHCLTCASFCTTVENIPEYEEEIEKVKQQIEISNRFGRELWAEKNKQYLNILNQTLEKVKKHKLVHKNSKSREDIV